MCGDCRSGSGLSHVIKACTGVILQEPKAGTGPPQQEELVWPSLQVFPLFLHPPSFVLSLWGSEDRYEHATSLFFLPFHCSLRRNWQFDKTANKNVLSTRRFGSFGPFCAGGRRTRMTFFLNRRAAIQSKADQSAIKAESGRGGCGVRRVEALLTCVRPLVRLQVGTLGVNFGAT